MSPQSDFSKPMRPYSLHLLLFLICLALPACKEEESPVPSQSFSYTFENSSEGWVAGFSDYPSDWDENRFEFLFEHTELPDEVNTRSGSLLVSGRNISDDLFMFVKKEITGLKPNHRYLVSFEIEVASQYPEESAGIGGSPGASVYLKAGATMTEPEPVKKNGDIRMNIDTGNQSQGGKDMQVLGNIGIPGENFSYQLIRLNNLQSPFSVQTNASGNLWVIVGTDSGFEGTTTLYYNTIEVIIKE